MSGFQSLIDWVKKHYNDPEVPLLVCMEATRCIMSSRAYYLHDKGFKVVVVLPNKSKNTSRRMAEK
ncbi:MAG: hypothetical protein IPO24_14540 [Bacteroidetes bacterium]|nr:hypothetical protein [Bacteroidota bacterium]